MKEPLIDIDELAKRLCVAKGTLYNWRAAGRLPFVKIGRCLRFDVAAIEEFLRTRSNGERKEEPKE